MWRKILPKILCELTGTPRYLPEFEWSSSWIYNLFRVYELVFWRRDGIRREHVGIVGKQQYSLSLEHYLVSWETALRSRLAFRIVRVPQLQLAGMRQAFGIAPYRFAIAFDAVTDVNPGVGGGSGSGAVVVTGSNPILNAFGWGPITDVAGITAVAYNAAAMTLLDKNGNNGVNRWAYSYTLMAPATGSHTLAYTAVGSDACDVVTLSYSGAAQTGQPDSHAANNATGVITVSASTTVVASGCWISAFGGNEAGGGTFTGTTRVVLGGGTTRMVNDSNGTVATGSNTYTDSWTGSAYGWVLLFSFAPAGGATPATTVTPQLLTLMVG